jgi:succinyl-diaminopimelate desuccinylase
LIVPTEENQDFGIWDGLRPNVVPAEARLICPDGSDKIFTGRAAHGSTPDRGDNAIFKAVNWLAEETQDPVLKIASEYFCQPDYLDRLGIKKECEGSGAQTLNLGIIEYGLAGRLVLTFDSRSPANQSGQEVMDKILALMPEGSEIEVINHQEALKADTDGELVRALRRAYEKSGREFKGIISGGGTYARTVPNCVAFGPMFEGQDCKIHDADENMSLEQMDEIYKIYLDAIEELAK